VCLSFCFGVSVDCVKKVGILRLCSNGVVANAGLRRG
jgi:hypothetical protein